MRIVGIDFRDGILFVPEVLLAANAMKAGMAILRPLLAETGAKPIGKVVIGTVKGDIHDIGKNLVAMMLEGAGFEVFDLGINTDADKFIAALDEHKPDILGMSALLTTTMPYMKVVVAELVKRGIRDDYIVLVGGAPLNEEFGAGGRRRRVLPRRGDRRGDGTVPGPGTPCPGRLSDGVPRMRAAHDARVFGALGHRLAGRRRAAAIRPAAAGDRLGALAASWSSSRTPGCRRWTCLPPRLHNRPERIPAAVRAAIARCATGYDRIFVAYADCGTGGLLDRVLEPRRRRAAATARTATRSTRARPRSRGSPTKSPARSS